MSSPTRRGPRNAEDRLRRLLIMLPWLMEQGEVSVAEATERFGMTEADLARDLELAAMCGLPPFVDELIDVFIDDGMIWVGVPRLFTRPLRLNSMEAWELLAAGRAAMQLPGADVDGPLGRGLAKLAAALGEDDTAGVRVELARSDLADRFAAAISAGEWVDIRYWSASSDEVAARRIAPRQLFSDRGEWYVSADDRRSGELRTFRLDRVEDFEPTGEAAPEATGPLPTPGEWFTDASIARVTLRLSPSAQWITERYPADEVSEPDANGWVTARMPLVSERWLVRTLLRLGPNAEVVEPSDAAEPVRAAAGRALARYRS